MLNLIVAEHLKHKRTFVRKNVIIGPLLVMILAFSMTIRYIEGFTAGTWNWWYTLFLPGVMAINCFLVIDRDKKKKYHHIFVLNILPEKMWLGKILLCSIYLLISNLVVAIGVSICGKLLGINVHVSTNVLAAVVLTVTFMWEVPLLMFLDAKFGMLLGVFTGIFMTLAAVITVAPSKIWWVFAPAIPVRMMCPILGIMPNGLPVPTDSTLRSGRVLLPGIVISMILFILLSSMTARWFGRREEK